MSLDGGTLLLGVAVLVVLFVLRGAISGIASKLVSNAILGLVLVGLTALFLDVEIALTPVSVLLMLLGGLPGGILVIGLAAFDIAFTGPSMVFVGSGFLSGAIHSLAETPGREYLGTFAQILGEYAATTAAALGTQL